MSTLTSPRNPVKPIRRREPLTASLSLTIKGVDYAVTSISPGEDGSRAWRLEKHGDGDAVYDVIRRHDGLVQCSCPSWEATYCNSVSTCKHGQALVMVGLLEAPKVEASTPEPVVPASSRPRHDAVRAFPALHHFGLAESAVKEGRAEWVPPAGKPSPTPELVPPLDRFDRAFYRAQNAVVEKRAEWLTSKPAEPSPSPEPGQARDIVILDDDGTPLETFAAMDRRHRDEDAALAAVRELRADWLSDKPKEDACCPDDDPSPCTACLNAPEPAELPLHTLPADLDGTDWDDDHVWNLGPDPAPAPPTLAAWLDQQVIDHRRLGGDNHAWLAGKLAALADQARFLDATTPDAFDDRLACMLDAAAARVEARAGGC